MRCIIIVGRLDDKECWVLGPFESFIEARRYAQDGLDRFRIVSLTGPKEEYEPAFILEKS